MYCSKCGASIPDEETVCPKCAFPVLEEKELEDLGEDNSEEPVRKLHFGRPKMEEQKDWELNLEELIESDSGEKKEVEVDKKNEKANVGTANKIEEKQSAEPEKRKPEKRKPVVTSSKALGESPLDSESGESSDELKRVLQTIFTTDKAATDHAPKSGQAVKEKTAGVEKSASVSKKGMEPKADKTKPSISSNENPAEEKGYSLAGPTQSGEMASMQSGDPAWADTLADATFDKVEKKAEEPNLPPLPPKEKSLAEAVPSAPKPKKEKRKRPVNKKARKQPLLPSGSPDIQEVHVIVAGLTRRALAATFDFCFVGCLTLLFAILAIWVFGPERLPGAESGIWGLLLTLPRDYPQLAGAYLTLFGTFFVIFEIFFSVTSGQTPGKMLFDLRLIQVDGERMSLARAILRIAGLLLAFAPLLLGLLLATIDRRKQGLHDKLAQTLIIRVAQSRLDLR